MPEDKPHEDDTGKSDEQRDGQSAPTNVVADDTDTVTLNAVSDLLRQLNRRLGRRGRLTVSFAILCGTIWWNWATIVELPGISTVVQRWEREPLPSGAQDRFTVAIARLEGDNEDTQRELIVDALQSSTGVKVLRFDRTIRLAGGDPESTVVLGHTKARGYLSTSGAHVLIWGRVLTSEGKNAFRLYWTTRSGEERRANDLYLPDQFSLPEVFWDDLEDVLGLLVLSTGAAFERKRGEFIADELVPFVQRVHALLESSDATQSWDPVARAHVRHTLANALETLGTQTGEDHFLQAAIAHYERALSVFTREQVPRDWAMIQSNLGIALATLGQQESDTQRLEDAITALNAALEVITREYSPLDWATIQLNLGSASRILGERESGTLRLEQAVAYCNAALEVYTRERAPLSWAMIQINLGTALQRLDQRDPSTLRLEQAVAAYNEGLSEITHERVPLDWAKAQNNLCSALRTLGARESDTLHLERAVAACKAALEVHTRESVPRDWAETQINLGNALKTLGKPNSDTGHLEEAVAAYNAALVICTHERDPFNWAMTQLNLCDALHTLGEWGSDVHRLEQAVAACKAARTVFTHERVPLYWAMTQNNLGNALRALGKEESGTKSLEEAIATYNGAIEVHSRERNQLNWAMTQNNLGIAHQIIGEREECVADVCQGLGAHLAAWEVFQQGAPGYAQVAAKNVQKDLAVLKDNFPSTEVETCLEKHEELLRQFFESNPPNDPESS